MSQEVTVKQLLEAGVHFGHPTHRWNPKMASFIFTDRNGVYIMDLEKTMKYLTEAANYLEKIAEEGGAILFVGTKRQAKDAIKAIAELTDMPYVNERWLGGMLTNFETVRRSVQRLDKMEKMEQEGDYQFITKKEVLQINKERAKLEKVLAGVRKMKRLPQAVFVIDPTQEAIAVQEARRLDIPVVALIDTNCDPDQIDYLIPGNDDAIRSVKLICDVIAKAVKSGRDKFVSAHGSASEEAGEETAESSAAVDPATLVEGIELAVEEKGDSDSEKSKVKKVKAKKV